MNTYTSIPILISGLSDIIGYTCPTGQTAIIKSINVSNESVNSGAVSCLWSETNGVGLGSTTNLFPIKTSGLILGYSSSNQLNDFITIKTNDKIILRSSSSGIFTAIISLLAQDN